MTEDTAVNRSLRLAFTGITDQFLAGLADWKASDLEHTTDTDVCWCQPAIEDVPPDGRIVIHRRTADGP